MTGLERELRALGGLVAWPEAPDVAPVVRAAVEGQPPSVLPWWRRRVVATVALAVLTTALAAALAVPQARTALLRVFGIGSVRVELVDELPAVPTEAAPIGDLGVPVTLDEARRRASFAVLAPSEELGDPDEVRFATLPVDQVSLVWRNGDGGVRLLVTEIGSTFGGETAVKKVAGSGTRVERLTVDGARALWIAGDRHVFVLLDPGRRTERAETSRLARNTLLVDRGTLTLRIEGDLTRAQALRVARSLTEQRRT